MPPVARRSSKPCDARVAELRQQFDSCAAAWDAEHGPASPRAAEFAARVAYLRSRCETLGARRVLDLGCGTGQVLLHLLPAIHSGVGVDISQVMIARARGNASDRRLHFYVSDAAEFCASCDETFDLVLLIGVIDHLQDAGGALRNIGRVLAREAKLIVISPHPYNPFFALKRLTCFGREIPPAHHLSPRGIIALAGHHGFRLVGSRALPYAAWPGMVRFAPALRHIRFPLLQGGFALEFCAGGSD